MSSDVRADVLIIGAGLCGLMVATTLVGRGQEITLLDKGRSVGGRLATRRFGGGHADHGAQFFTVRHDRFASWVEHWRAEDLIYTWSRGWSDGSIAATPPDGHPRYAVNGGMNALARHLAGQVETAGAAIHTGVRALSVIPQTDGWQVTTDTDARFGARAVVLTAPVPQSLALLDAGATPLSEDMRATLERIRYASCLCGLFSIEGEVHLPAPGALQRSSTDISWIADNRRKGISPDATVVTVHAGARWSETHYGDPDEVVATLLEAELRPWLASDASVQECQVKRWRFAAPTVLHSSRMVCIEAHAPLYIGGDAFFEPRVEGAALSGLMIGDALVAEG